MGQKVNPESFRMSINKNWKSKWFANKKDFSKNILEDLEIRKAVNSKFGKTAGIGKVEISRNQDAVEIVIKTSKPGILIGRSGQGITELKKQIASKVKTLQN